MFRHHGGSRAVQQAAVCRYGIAAADIYPVTLKCCSKGCHVRAWQGLTSNLGSLKLGCLVIYQHQLGAVLLQHTPDRCASHCLKVI
jgi:hypothetical protein